MIYRVVVKVGYREALFDFSAGINALNFASDVLCHRVPNTDDRETEDDFGLSMQFIRESEEEEQEE